MIKEVKSQKPFACKQAKGVKSAIQKLKPFVLSCAFTFLIFNFTVTSHAKDITIIYTGETHSMLYACSCPKEPDGGVARRATLIKQLRKNNPDALLLDSGGFFAGGLMDEYTQNTELDIERTRVSLRAMEMMHYDAVSIGDDEFNFGKDFLQEAINKTNLPFLSCNLKADKVLPYIVKEVSGVKIGIIAVTSLSAMQKAGGLQFLEPKIAVAGVVGDLKKQGVGVIVLLSHLGETEDLRLLETISGIDIIISGHNRNKEDPFTKVGSTLILRPTWQGRRLDKITFSLKDNKIVNYKVENVRLSDKVNDDTAMLSILPKCFSDSNCKKKGLVGVCQDPGTLKSRCLFSEAVKIDLTIIMPKACILCNSERIISYLKTQFPGLTVSYLNYPDPRSNKMVKDFGIKGLPAYLLAKDIEKEKGFDSFKENLELKGDFYMLKSQFSGISYFIDRKNIKGKLDLFISLYDKNIKELLDVMKDFNPNIHFLAVESPDKFEAAKGNIEVEEYLRSLCVQKYYPKDFLNYISCRARSIDSSWWEDCLAGLDVNKIKNCARTKEGSDLLKENISLNKDLQILFGPTYLLDNQEVFSSQGVPTKEEFKKTIKR